MAGRTIDIVPCPSNRIAEALALALCDLAPTQRREIAAELIANSAQDPLRLEGLCVALQGDDVVGAAWGQRQPGNTAVFWPPQFAGKLTGPDELFVPRALSAEVTRALDAAGIVLTQTLLPAWEQTQAAVLASAGFRWLADLIYLACEAENFPNSTPASAELEFDVYDESQKGRLGTLIERTYDSTLDCPALDGVRSMDDVIAGYQATGIFQPAHWRIVRNREEDIGVLLLADHPEMRHWELLYMGLVPSSRGHGWGAQITRQAQWMARVAGVERIVLAADAANIPATNIYTAAGFVTWDRRSVFVRRLNEAAS